MAATDSMPVPKKNTAFRHYFYLLDSDGAAVTSAAGLDSEVSKDGGAYADCTNEATEIGQGLYYLDLTSTEMNADVVAVLVKTSSSGAIPERVILAPQETGDIPVTVTGMANNIITASTIATDAITSDQLASDAAAKVADAVWDEDITTHIAADSAGEVQNLITPFYQAVTSSLTTITNRIGSFTGTGVNTILGFFKALMSKDASTPSDVGGTYSAATDAAEALRDNVGTAVNATISADIAAVKGETASILADTGTDGVVLSSAAVDAVWAKTMSDLAAMPAANASVLSAVNAMYMEMRNRKTQTSSATVTYRDDGSTAAWTRTVTPSTSTTIRGEAS